MLGNLDIGNYLEIAILLYFLFALLRLRHAQPRVPMSPDTRAFMFELVKNNTGLCWAFISILVFLFALFYLIHQPDGREPQVLTGLMTLLATASGWMGGLLTGRLMARTADHGELLPGTLGTQDTVVTTHKETVAAPVPPIIPPVDPATPIVVQKVIDPVKIEGEEPKP